MKNVLSLILWFEEFYELSHEWLQNHIAQIHFDLSFFELIVKPVVLLLDSVRGEDRGQPSLAHLLECVLLKLVLARAHVREVEHGPRHAAAEHLRPPEDLLLDHLEKPLCVNARNLYFGLQSAHLIRPGHWLAYESIGPELH